MKIYWGMEVQLHTFLSLALDGNESVTIQNFILLFSVLHIREGKRAYHLQRTINIQNCRFLQHMIFMLLPCQSLDGYHISIVVGRDFENMASGG
jgi:hypothetical protein